MFAYIQIIDENNKTFNGYAAFEFIDGILTLSFMTGLRRTVRVKIPISEVEHLTENQDFGSRISFDYDQKHYIFLDSGYGESQFLKENFLETIK
ncbi:hypothetical protein [Companilactobacillus sp.]|jgi:hypothetical protein|uniref:hypothetical protein n=1 Tax=Companilactobacillus sp. TaxID=2767905 RepID=UPI0025C71AC8|nr:hypothetical protein [Companilactobacillus sp.]MCH4008531.1 hypothetical protein [Companilactobacillus sp.]MCH4051290.1 hypothetical protein [Companilactobacillus sp.]MCH4076474.1 hypothetical protein [Companilactobacillus sp.]MCH4125049.1 hypothetical protein [Companilactobacillus sp.]MCH4131590.1 hypothetical protein [Companilactobacillus sp.]